MRPRGFTLIELLVVMAIIATLLTIVTPRYFRHLEHTKETALHQTLNVVRDSIDKYFADKGVYPATLEDLVEKRYLRQLPVDPITGKSTGWVLVPPPDEPTGGVWDVQSGAEGSDGAGTAYKEY